MCKYIGVEDLAANALIELLESSNINTVKFKTLYEYGIEVLKVLKQNGQEAVLLFSRNHTDGMLRNYSDFFEIITTPSGDDCIALRAEKTVTDLRNHFRAFLTLNLLMAFTDKQSLTKLGVMN